MRVVRGRSLTINCEVLSSDTENVFSKTPIDLTGCAVKAIFKYDPNDTDASAILLKEIGSGVTVVSATTGKLDISLGALDTIKFLQNKIYFEVVVKLANNSLVSSFIREIIVEPNVLKVPF